MLGQEKALKILDDVLEKSGADQTEALIMGHDHCLTRYANSQIHQNMAEENATLFVKAVLGKKIGVSVVNNFHPKKIESAVQNACLAAKNADEIEDFPGLAKKKPIPGVSIYVPRTAEIVAEEKALIVQDMITRTHGESMMLNGAFYTGAAEMAVANTNGIRTYARGTLSNITALTSSKETSGYASGSARDVDQLDYAKLVEEALESARAYEKTVTLEPGKYPVILEEYAVADLLMYLGYMGLNAESVENERSFIIPHKGKKVFKKDIFLYEDAMDPDTFMMPFDFEGVPKKRVDFIKQGVVTGDYVHNTYTAARAGVESTGHGLPPGSGLNRAYPFHLFLNAGDKTDQQMLSMMDRGLLIKRFHYLTSVHDLKTVVSGMTRDGVFLVEKGRITARVSNMRFTQSIIEALKHVKAMSATRKPIWFREYSLDTPVTAVVPRLFIEEFNFTGQTEF